MPSLYQNKILHWIRLLLRSWKSRSIWFVQHASIDWIENVLLTPIMRRSRETLRLSEDEDDEYQTPERERHFNPDLPSTSRQAANANANRRREKYYAAKSTSRPPIPAGKKTSRNQPQSRRERSDDCSSPERTLRSRRNERSSPPEGTLRSRRNEYSSSSERTLRSRGNDRSFSFDRTLHSRSNDRSSSPEKTLRSRGNERSSSLRRPPPSNARSRPRKQIQPRRKPNRDVLFLKEVRKLQNTILFMIPKAAFGRLVREIMLNCRTEVTHITRQALEALQEATEMYITQKLNDAYILTLHRNRVTLSVKDIEILRVLKLIE